MTRIRWGTVMVGCMVWLGGLSAQQTQTIDLDENDAWQGRPFLVKLGTHTDAHQSGRWTGASQLQEYAKAHPAESYLLFVQAGSVYRLDTPASLAELQHLHEPLDALAAVQHDLAAAQAPLAEEQRALGEQMRSTRNPAAMGRIGEQQGAVGRRQGLIGREQGAIGRQQGVLGRAFYQSAQGLIDTCLRENTCRAVAPDAPATAQR